MKKLQLSKGSFALVDDSDYAELAQYKWYKNNTGYACRSAYLGKIDGKYRNATILLHRELMNTPRGFDTDYINGDTLDNRRSNLRVCTRSQNRVNTSTLLKTKHTELPTGVTLNANPRSLKKFTARIHDLGKAVFIGNYMTSQEAKEAYEIKANELFKGYRRLNVR